MLKAIIFDFDGVIADTERLHYLAFRDVLAEDGVDLAAQDYTARYLGRADEEVFRAIARDRGLALDEERLQALLARKAGRYEGLVGGGNVLIEGVADKVREWHEQVPLAVASGARRVEVEGILASAGLLRCFAAVVAAEDVMSGKPDPDPYLVAVQWLERAQEARRKSEELEIEKAVGGRRRRERRRGEPGPAAGSGERREVDMPGGGRREDDWIDDAEPVLPRNVVAIEDSISGVASAKAAGMRIVAVTTNFPAHRLADADLVVSSVADLQLEALRRLVDPRRL